MVDEIFDRHYQTVRRELNASISGTFSRLIDAIRNAFEVLVKIEYQSPWTAPTRKAKCN